MCKAYNFLFPFIPPPQQEQQYTFVLDPKKEVHNGNNNNNSNSKQTQTRIVRIFVKYRIVYFISMIIIVLLD